MSKDYTNYKFMKDYMKLDDIMKEKVFNVITIYKSDPHMTLTDAATLINDLTDLDFNCKTLSHFMVATNILPKDRSLTYKNRMHSHSETVKARDNSKVEKHIERLNQKGVDKARFINLYYEDTLKNIEKKYDISVYDIHKIANYYGLKNFKRQYTYKDLKLDLLKNSITKEDIIEIYNNQNLTFDKTVKWFSKKVDRQIGSKVVINLLKDFGISKTDKQIKALQGRKSRKEKINNMRNFEEIAGCTMQELADRYENDKSLTKQSLLAELNSKVDDEHDLITHKWLGRNMDPLLSIPRLGIVSRLELELGDFVQELLGNIKIIRSDRYVIAPKEVDIYIPELNVAIEFNGDYWHSDSMLLKSSGMTSLNYHTNKRDLCKKLDIDLIFVWESDWNCNKDEVKLALNNYFKFNVDNPILNKLTNGHC